IGENYARSVGIRVERDRIIMIGITSVITGTITAFTGPIAFLGIAVPHFTRLLFKSSNYRILLPGTVLCGALLMLICDIITQLPGRGFVLPINAITSMIGAPVVIWTIARNRKKRLIF
ncbi:iron chelate uptake ABC transporter family permease subunit, partial [Porphyromonas loveana]